MRILVVTAICPYPPNSGTPLRTYNLISRLAREHEIWLVTFFHPTDHAEQAIAHLRSLCARVEAIPYHAERAFHRPADFFVYLLRRVPPDLRFYMSSEMLRTVRSLTADTVFDIVQIEDSYMALFFEALPAEHRNKAVITMIDLMHVKYDRIYRLEPTIRRRFRLWLQSRMMRAWEPRYMEHFQRCLMMSEVDRQLLQLANPRVKTAVVPNGVDTKLYSLLPETDSRPEVLFVGNMGYRPNIDGAKFFCREVLPLLRRALPTVQFWLVGIDPAPEVLQLQGDGVHVTGAVEDVRPYYDRSAVCVVPLRAGGGTRLKILEAMALGRPIVSTRIGCEGIDATDGEHLLLADDAEDFAEKVAQLITDPVLRQYIVENARQLVEDRYDWDAITDKLTSVYAEVAADSGSG